MYNGVGSEKKEMLSPSGWQRMRSADGSAHSKYGRIFIFFLGGGEERKEKNIVVGRKHQDQKGFILKNLLKIIILSHICTEMQLIS